MKPKQILRLKLLPLNEGMLHIENLSTKCMHFFPPLMKDRLGAILKVYIYKNVSLNRYFFVKLFYKVSQ